MIPIHTISLLPGSTQAQNNQVILGRFVIPNLIGGGAGLNVATAIATIGELPPDYTVLAVPSQDAIAHVTAKTAAGFTLNLIPRDAAVTLAAGSTDIIIIG